MYPNYYYNDNYGFFEALAGFMAVYSVVALAIAAVTIVAMWKLFVKAGEEGWAAIVPFYNLYVLYKITWGNGVLFLLLLIPFANIVIHIVTMVKLARAFGKGGGWACGLIFLNTIFICIMAFSQDIQYVGVPGQQTMDYGPGAYNNPGGGYQDPYQRGRQQSAAGQNADPYQNAYQQRSRENDGYYYQRTEEPKAGAPAFCPQCGAPAETGAKFCASCGKQL